MTEYRTYMVDADGCVWVPDGPSHWSLLQHLKDECRSDECLFTRRTAEQANETDGPMRLVMDGRAVILVDGDGDVWFSDGTGGFVLGLPDDDGPTSTRDEIEEGCGPVYAGCGHLSTGRNICLRPDGHADNHADGDRQWPDTDAGVPDSCADAPDSGTGATGHADTMTGAYTVLSGFAARVNAALTEALAGLRHVSADTSARVPDSYRSPAGQCPRVSTGGRPCHLVAGHNGTSHIDLSGQTPVAWMQPDSWRAAS